MHEKLYYNCVVWGRGGEMNEMEMRRHKYTKLLDIHLYVENLCLHIQYIYKTQEQDVKANGKIIMITISINE